VIGLHRTPRGGPGRTDIYFVWLREGGGQRRPPREDVEKRVEKIQASSEEGARPASRARERDKEKAKSRTPARGRLRRGPAGGRFITSSASTRQRRVAGSDTRRTDLFWSHDRRSWPVSGKRDGKAGVYTVEFPKTLKPSCGRKRGQQPRALEACGESGSLAVRGRAGAVSELGEGDEVPSGRNQEVDRPRRTARPSTLWLDGRLRDHW